MESGLPVKDPKMLAELEALLQLVMSDGLPQEHPDKSMRELEARRASLADSLVESQDEIEEMVQQVREMDSEKVADIVADTRVSTANVQVQTSDDEETVVLRVQAEDRPGMLPRVLEEIDEAQWNIVDASIVSDGVNTTKEFTLSRSAEGAESGLPDVFQSVDDAALVLSYDLMKIIETNPENEVVSGVMKRAEQKRIDEESEGSADAADVTDARLIADLHSGQSSPLSADATRPQVDSAGGAGVNNPDGLAA